MAMNDYYLAKKAREATRLKGAQAAMSMVRICDGCRAKSSQRRLVQTEQGLLCIECAAEKGCKEEYMEAVLKRPEPPKPEAPKPQSFGDWS